MSGIGSLKIFRSLERIRSTAFRASRKRSSVEKSFRPEKMSSRPLVSTSRSKVSGLSEVAKSQYHLGVVDRRDAEQVFQAAQVQRQHRGARGGEGQAVADGGELALGVLADQLIERDDPLAVGVVRVLQSEAGLEVEGAGAGDGRVVGIKPSWMPISMLPSAAKRSRLRAARLNWAETASSPRLQEDVLEKRIPVQRRAEDDAVGVDVRARDAQADGGDGVVDGADLERRRAGGLIDDLERATGCPRRWRQAPACRPSRYRFRARLSMAPSTWPTLLRPSRFTWKNSRACAQSPSGRRRRRSSGRSPCRR